MSGNREAHSQRNGVVIRIDHEICAGFADCVTAAPGVFALNSESVAVVEDPEAVGLSVLHQAAEACPVSAILLFDEGGGLIAPEL